MRTGGLLMKTSTQNTEIRVMNEACVALMRAGDVPGVKIDSHNSTTNPLLVLVFSSSIFELAMVLVSLTVPFVGVIESDMFAYL